QRLRTQKHLSLSLLSLLTFKEKNLRLINFYDNRDNNDNVLLTTSTVLSVDNNKNNFYQPKGWLPLETC
ncbi:MAG: hypothetical protein SO142_01760, partial [Prevotella sp.]|nr:hypothetical protein [Prevotella sp.]